MTKTKADTFNVNYGPYTMHISRNLNGPYAVTLQIGPRAGHAGDRLKMARNLAVHFDPVGYQILNAIPEFPIGQDRDPIGPFYTPKQLAIRLRIPRRDVYSMAYVRELICLVDDAGSIRFPLFQFTDDFGVYPEVLDVHNFLESASGSPWVAALWLCEATSPNPHNTQATRLCALQAGGVAAINVAAEARDTAQRWAAAQALPTVPTLGPRLMARVEKGFRLIGIPVEGFIEDVATAFSQIEPKATPTSRPAPGLDARRDVPEVENLGGEAHDFPRLRYAAIMAGWIAHTVDSWSVDDVASHLRMHPSVVRDMADRGDLFASIVGTHLRFAGWQFLPTGLIAGTSELTRAFRVRSVGAVDANRFMRRPTHALTLGGSRLTPMEWLAKGKPVTPVISHISAERSFDELQSGVRQDTKEVAR